MERVLVESERAGRVHPAVLRLGLAYAQGALRGGNARCVALLSTLRTLLQARGSFRCPLSTPMCVLTCLVPWHGWLLIQRRAHCAILRWQGEFYMYEGRWRRTCFLQWCMQSEHPDVWVAFVVHCRIVQRMLSPLTHMLADACREPDLAPLRRTMPPPRGAC